MNTILTAIFILAFSFLHSQDTSKINQIDNIVSRINASTLPAQRDTIIQDVPQIGLKMTTYVTIIVNNQELIKYVNHVISTTTENGVSKKITGANTFYFEHNKLIKIEEYLIEEDKKTTSDWYYSANNLLYHMSKSDKAADKTDDRAALLLEIADELLKKSIK